MWNLVSKCTVFNAENDYLFIFSVICKSKVLFEMNDFSYSFKNYKLVLQL